VGEDEQPASRKSVARVGRGQRRGRGLDLKPYLLDS
jgi:hypothetical protein